MKFDTRDTKPKLYNILILTVIVAVVVGVLSWLDYEAYALQVSIIMLLYFLLSMVMLLHAFFGQLAYNPYSYNTIFYMGFALFILSVVITHIILTARMIRSPEDYNAYAIVFLLLSSAKTYMLLSFPFVLIFSTALCISNISLIRHEGRRLVNILGIILSFLMVGGALLLYRLDYYVSGSQAYILKYELFTNLYAAVYLYFECMLIGAIIADIIAARYVPAPDKDVLIILGCGIRKDGTPSPLLRGRVDQAIAFAERQKKQTGKELLFITSGGQGPDEVIPESRSMKQYMISRGIPEERIIEEDRSSNTFENMKFSKEIIMRTCPEAKIAFSTTNYHVFRSGLFARRVKMRAQGMGAKTKWYFWPNASVREFVGLITEHRGKQAAILGGMIVIYVALTFAAYL